jgi:hypothetical protein
VTAPTEIDHVVVDAVQRSAAQFAVADRPVALVRARAEQRQRRQRTTSALAAIALVVGGGLVTARIVDRDQPTVAPVAGFTWTRIELPLGSDGAAGMLAVDGTGPFYGVEYVAPRSERIGVAVSIDGVAWQPLRSAPPLVSSASTSPALTAVGDRVALVGRLADEHDGHPADTLVLTTSADRGATWRTTELVTELTDIWSAAAALEPDGVVVAFAGNAAPPPPEPTDPGVVTPLMQLLRVDERGVVSPVSTETMPEVESWTLVMLDESADGLVLGGGDATVDNEWAGNVFVHRFIDDADSWTELGPATPSPLWALSLSGDTTLAVGADSFELPDGTGRTSLHAQTRTAWVRGAWQSTALDELIPERLRQRVTYTISINRWTVENGPAGLAIAAQLLERDETGSADGGRAWIREQGTSPHQMLWSADGTNWTAFPLDQLAGANVFFARPLMRDDGTLIIATYVESGSTVVGDVVTGAPSWRTIVLVGEPTG